MTSSSKSARTRRAKQAQQRRASADADADAAAAQSSSLEDSLRALNAKLIARLRTSEAVAADAVTARTVAQQALQTAQRGRKSIDGSMDQLAAERDALARERDEWKGKCHQLKADVDQLTKRVAGLGDELLRVSEECDRLRRTESAVTARCETLEKQLADGKEKLHAERMVIASMERQLEEYVADAAKSGANMSPQSYSSIDTGDTLRSDTGVSGSDQHTAVRLQDESASAPRQERAAVVVESTTSASRAPHPIVRFFEAIWTWAARVVSKWFPWVGGGRSREREAVPLLSV